MRVLITDWGHASIQFWRRIPALVRAIFAFDLPQAPLGVAESQRVDPRAGHVEFEANLLTDESSEVGLVRPADRVVEGIALPLIHTAWLTALCFTMANALLLTVRIRVENAALGYSTSSGHADAPA